MDQHCFHAPHSLHFPGDWHDLSPKVLVAVQGSWLWEVSFITSPSECCPGPSEEPVGADCGGIHTSQWVHHHPAGGFFGTPICHVAAQPSLFADLCVMSCLVQFFSVAWVVEGGKKKSLLH